MQCGNSQAMNLCTQCSDALGNQHGWAIWETAGARHPPARGESCAGQAPLQGLPTALSPRAQVLCEGVQSRGVLGVAQAGVPQG